MMDGTSFTNKIQKIWIVLVGYHPLCYAKFISMLLLMSVISLLIILGISIGTSYGSEEQRVECGGRLWNIEASLSIGSIDTITVDTDNSIMVLSVDSSSLQTNSTDSQNGALSIVLPRDLLDAMEEGHDLPFRALGDGAELDIEETRTTPTHREVEIPISTDIKTIEIIGIEACPPIASFIEIPRNYHIVETGPEGYFTVGTRWAPSSPIDKEQNAILAVRFSPNKGVIDYGIEISDGTGKVFQASRSISGTNDDTIQIPRNTFPIGSRQNPEGYEVEVRVERFYGVDSDERASGLSIQVIPEFQSQFITMIIVGMITTAITILSKATSSIYRGLFRDY